MNPSSPLKTIRKAMKPSISIQLPQQNHYTHDRFITAKNKISIL